MAKKLVVAFRKGSFHSAAIANKRLARLLLESKDTLLEIRLRPAQLHELRVAVDLTDDGVRPRKRRTNRKK
ncbi:MAG TPA: hypothetical protein VN934_10390 [Candidatus Tumulicola sp.]|nr:hypothetical protein [Candidatus Tumulicola sp.]